MSLDREKTELQETGSVMLPRQITLAETWEIVDDLGIDPRKVRVTAYGGCLVYLENDVHEERVSGGE